ncbi:MAG TPA: DUF983 domain-containing protein, partial [Arenibaculum sp.]|nr:DUF983 domain-containing protein [Arenibaculum sp.]
SLLSSMMRGVRRRCPACGKGNLFAGYLKAVGRCTSCGLEIGEFRSDDAPPYFTIFIVGHVVIPGMLLMEQWWHPPSWVHMATWLPLTVLLTFWLLPLVKGAVIGAQWALKIKG